MQIREATPTDKEAVLSLLDQLCNWDKCTQFSEPSFLAALENDFMKVFVAEDETIVGEATIIITPAIRYNKKRIIVDELVVDESQRGKGVGTALIKHIIEYAKSIDAHSVWVTSQTDRTDAHEFYKELGFRLYEYNFRFDL